jgi:hypothetical protein
MEAFAFSGVFFEKAKLYSYGLVFLCALRAFAVITSLSAVVRG